MKKSKKCDFKKLALLGIAGGTVVSTQLPAEINNVSELLAFNGCAGAPQGCSGMGSRGGSYQAYRNVPSQNYYYSAPSSGCGGSSQQYYQGSSQYYQGGASCASASQGQQYYPSYSSCGGSSSQYYQPSGSYQTAPQYHQYQSYSCGAATSQSSSPSYAAHASSGCASIAQGSMEQSMPSTTPMPTASNDRTYTKWETSGYTADANNVDSTTTTTTTSKRTITESELLSQLNEEGKQLYNSLDTEGKAMAVRLANQDNFKDKNLAVKVAAQMAEKRKSGSSKY